MHPVMRSEATKKKASPKPHPARRASRHAAPTNTDIHPTCWPLLQPLSVPLPYLKHIPKFEGKRSTQKLNSPDLHLAIPFENSGWLRIADETYATACMMRWKMKNTRIRLMRKTLWTASSHFRGCLQLSRLCPPKHPLVAGDNERHPESATVAPETCRHLSYHFSGVAPAAARGNTTAVVAAAPLHRTS